MSIILAHNFIIQDLLMTGKLSNTEEVRFSSKFYLSIQAHLVGLCKESIMQIKKVQSC